MVLVQTRPCLHLLKTHKPMSKHACDQCNTKGATERAAGIHPSTFQTPDGKQTCCHAHVIPSLASEKGRQ